MANCTCPCPPPSTPCGVHFVPGPGYQMAAYLASPWFYHDNHRLHPDHEGQEVSEMRLRIGEREGSRTRSLPSLQRVASRSSLTGQESGYSPIVLIRPATF